MSSQGGFLNNTTYVVSTSVSDKKILPIKKGSVILFQGDSITNAGRNKFNLYPNSSEALGGGYVLLTAASLLTKYPERNYAIYNRGIGGNKVHQLAERWDKDCIELNPSLISILIGVNDFWYLIDGDYKGTIETYENDYRALLKRTIEALPDVQFVICEPYALEGGEVTKDWFPAFDQYSAVSKKLAQEFNAVFVPFQTALNEALKVAPFSYWLHDGVHPSLAGAELLSQAWMAALKE